VCVCVRVYVCTCVRVDVWTCGRGLTTIVVRLLCVCVCVCVFVCVCVCVHHLPRAIAPAVDVLRNISV